MQHIQWYPPAGGGNYTDLYNEYRRNRHSICKLQYHLVAVTKFRHPVLTGDIAERLEQISHEVIEEDWNCRILEINTDQDHVHILFEASPQTQLSKLVNNYKTVTSRLLRKEFSSALSKYCGKPLFWSDSYFLSTVSETTEEAVRIYIQEQGKRDNDGFHRPTGRRKAADHA
ncbi:MAG: IS200/IS605 family transposase [Stecheria intestinalis]|nr:IS200/IS605 family transposase [Stecheria intestinalis]